MKIHSLVLLLILLLSLNTIAQDHYDHIHYQGYNTFTQNKKIYVILPELDNDFISKQEGKTEEIETYKRNILQLKGQVKKHMNKSWRLNDSIIYISMPEALELNQSKKNESSFLLVYPENYIYNASNDDIYLATQYGVGAGMFPTVIFDSLVGNIEAKANLKRRKEKSLSTYKNSFKKPGKDKEAYFTFKFFCKYKTYSKKDKVKDNIMIFSKNTLGLTSEDFQIDIVLFSTMSYFNYYHEGNKKGMGDYVNLNSTKLNNKTLFVLKNQIGKKITESEFKSIYPYKVSFVSQEEYNQAITDKRKDICILSIEPIKQMSKYAYPPVITAVYGHYIYSTDSFEMLGGQIPIITPYKYSPNYNIKASRVKKYAK